MTKASFWTFHKVTVLGEKSVPWTPIFYSGLMLLLGLLGLLGMLACAWRFGPQEERLT